MASDTKDYQDDFSDEGFWTKVKNFALAAGAEVIEKALWLYYALQQSGTPAWAKGTIIGALGYFISPIDAIPDLIPVVGYADDLGVLALAVTTVAASINDEVKKAASLKMADWFGTTKK